MAVEKKFVQEGLRKAQMSEYFMKQLNRAGYGGLNVNRTPMGTQITIYAEKPGMVIGKSGKTIHKLTTDMEQLFKIDNPQIDVQEVSKPELNAQTMANRLASALERGWYFRKAGHSTVQRIMDAGALGCEVIISGKLTGPRKRREKFVRGKILHAGKPAEENVMVGYAQAIKKQGVLGVQVRIILPTASLPDQFKVKKDEEQKTEQKTEQTASEHVGKETQVEQKVETQVKQKVETQVEQKAEK
ncbi:MAG: 30S ribosomal protein S3 [Methanocellales archaeon]